MVTWELWCAWSLNLILPGPWRFVSGSWDGKPQSQISMPWSMDDNICEHWERIKNNFCVHWPVLKTVQFPKPVVGGLLNCHLWVTSLRACPEPFSHRSLPSVGLYFWKIKYKQTSSCKTVIAFLFLRDTLNVLWGVFKTILDGAANSTLWLTEAIMFYSFIYLRIYHSTGNGSQASHMVGKHGTPELHVPNPCLF